MKKNFSDWFQALQKCLRQCTPVIEVAKVKYEVLRIYFDPWSGVPMLGLYRLDNDQHVGFPLYQMFELNPDLPYEKKKKEEKS